MRRMTIETKPFFGRTVRLQGIGIDLPVMARVTKDRRIVLQQSPIWRRMTIMAGQTLTFTGWLMHTLRRARPVTLIMTFPANFGRFIGQHSGILTGMHGMALLAVTLLDRHVLSRGRNLIVTGQAEPTFNSLHGNCGAIDLVTVITIATAHRGVDNFPEQSRITGTMLGVAVDASVFDRVALMGRNELGVFNRMTRGAEVVVRYVQQARLVTHMRVVTITAAILHRGVNFGPGKRLRIMAVKAELFRRNLKKLGILRIVRFVTSIAFAL